MLKIAFPYPDCEHLGVEYLMAICRNEGHTVEYFYYRNHDQLFNKRFQTDFNKLSMDIIAKGTQIAAFSCITDNFRAQLRLAESIKKLSPDIICIFGGIHITAVPEKVLAHDAVDCIALGEADESVIELLKGITCKNNKLILPENPISGIVIKKGAKRIGIFDTPEFPDLDTRPFPYKEPFYRSRPDAKSVYYILATRGCPYNCSFCYNSSSYLNGKKSSFLSRRSVENVISELLWAKEYFSPHSVWFVDDCFTTDSKWLLFFCNEYKSKVKLPFICFAHPIFMDKTKADMLKDAGCYNVQLGVQSLSEEVCKNINRKGEKKHVSDAIACLKKSGILVAVDHIFGLPGDTLEIEEDAALFYNEHRPFWINALWLTYYPKTVITESAKNNGVIDPENIEKIEQGFSADDGYIVGSAYIKNIEQYYGISFLFNWMPFLPKFFVRFIIKKRLYRKLRFNSYFLGVLVPRGIRSFHPRFARKNFWIKIIYHLYRDLIGKRLNLKNRKSF